ncbi:MAG: 3-dehydroquinate synthase [Desulfobulbus propionicus]|nr:MAG: 3-dehydroquinate synthase [Desulfobulbus propionicus]
MQTQLTVGLGERAYPIHLQHGLLHEVGPVLATMNLATRWGVISDDRVAGLYGKSLLASLQRAGVDACLFTFSRGEASKNLGTVGRLASQLAASRFDRKDGLIALGGGVPGDITGFVASLYMRGIPFVQVPTSLLAQVDSSVGGKTGVDLPEGKNLVGTFYQPSAVFLDPQLLGTLDPQELRGGLAEVIKHAVIADEAYFAFMEDHRKAVLQLEEKTIGAMIRRSCEIKAEVVGRDEREGGLRRMLNFGHTIGHAVEAASNFSIIHGLAVAIGMRCAADLAVRGGLLDPDAAIRIRQLLCAYGLPVTVPQALDREQIKGFLRTDKKTVGGRVFFVLPTAVGRVAITDEVKESDIDAVLADG